MIGRPRRIRQTCPSSITDTTSKDIFFNLTCIKRKLIGHSIIIDITSVVDNRGEDLRFPISSSSGFSSPMKNRPSKEGLFLFTFKYVLNPIVKTCMQSSIRCYIFFSICFRLQPADFFEPNFHVIQKRCMIQMRYFVFL